MHFILTKPIDESVPVEVRKTIRYVFSDPTVAPVALYGLHRKCPLDTDGRAIILLPENWHPESAPEVPHVAYHNGMFRFQEIISGNDTSDGWISISNARYMTSFDRDRLDALLTASDADVTAISIDPSLAKNYEKFIFTSAGHVAGFSRLYKDSVLPGKQPDDWPHLLFVKRSVFNRIFSSGTMPLDFSEFYGCITAGTADIRSFRLGGAVQDLQRHNGLLDFISAGLDEMHPETGLIFQNPRHESVIPDSVRIYGRILVGGNVSFGNHVVLVGPAILCDNVLLTDKSVVRRSIIGTGCFGGKEPLIRDGVIDLGQNHLPRPTTSARTALRPSLFTKDAPFVQSPKSHFKTWPLFSYPRFFKRIADFVIALGVLILLAPLFPLIAAAIKLTSSGPVFFGHKRQGLHAKEFYCLKFRTMIPGADNIQDKLRCKNQVDGPQFKIEDDPRVTAVGRFLRNTYIDEIPQFINVLKGQMSLIGPRPSPQKENSLCPIWHDARLSVRPGITGLWQIKRTRQPGKDFQEWIYYDLEYIRNLSPKMDLQICWETVKKIAFNFFSQF